MGISGDAILDDGLPDLGDRRHKNLLKKNKRKAVNGDDSKEDDGQEDDGLELLGFEVMDSEDDSDDAEDPFKLVQRKRAATSIVDEGFNSRRVIKRSKTDPGESKKKKKDLLSVLLPDNVDSSTIEKDFSIIQESTQMTSMVSHGDHKEDDNNSLKAEDLKSVLEDDENASEHTNDESEGSQDIVLEKIEVYDVAGSKGWYEKNLDSGKGMAVYKKEQQDSHDEQKDERVNVVAKKVEEENSLEILDAEAFNKKENVQMDNSVPTDLSEEPNTIKENNTEANDSQPDLEKDSLSAAVTTSKKGTTTY
ncbi:unnamed protein product [Wickerhamomyces anomalus]